MTSRRTPSRRDPTISLINIVFLILIFFMVSSTLSRTSSADLAFVQTEGLDCCAGVHVLQVNADGELFENGQPIESPQTYLDARPADDRTVRIAPDRALPAQDLLILIGELRAKGAERVVVITENRQGSDQG